MKTSQCPDYKATGGKVSHINGSSHPSWSNDIGLGAIVLVYSMGNDFAAGLAICDIILQRNLDHAKTVGIRGELIMILETQFQREVIKFMTREVGGREHWY